MKTNKIKFISLGITLGLGLAVLLVQAALAEPPVPAQITKHPAGLIVSPGSTVTFTVEATGTPPLRYRWRKQSRTLIGETNATLVVTNARERAYYTVIVSNDAGGELSRYAPLSFFTLTREEDGMGLNLEGLTAEEFFTQFTYELQYKTEAAATNWIALTNLALPTSPYRYVDPGAAQSPQRFYRARLLPWW